MSTTKNCIKYAAKKAGSTVAKSALSSTGVGSAIAATGAVGSLAVGAIPIVVSFGIGCLIDSIFDD